MDIAALSMNLSQMKMAQASNIAVMKLAMETAQGSSDGLAKMLLDTAQVRTTPIDPNLGSILDILI